MCILTTCHMYLNTINYFVYEICYLSEGVGIEAILSRHGLSTLWAFVTRPSRYQCLHQVSPSFWVCRPAQRTGSHHRRALDLEHLAVPAPGRPSQNLSTTGCRWVHMLYIIPGRVIPLKKKRLREGI